MEISQILVNLGFSPNETVVYLASLELGQAAAQEIAKKAKLKRTTAYSVLEGLVKKGFIIKANEHGKSRFIADNPKNLVKQFSDYQKSLENALPQLEAIHNQKEVKPKVLFFEGKEGIKKIYLDTIKEKPEVILEYTTSDFFKVFPGFPTEYLKQRRENNISAKRIAPKDIRWSEHAKKDEEELSETKLIPLDNFNIPVEINVYNDKVAFMSYTDEFGLIIESKAIADAMKQVYELSWLGAKSVEIKKD